MADPRTHDTHRDDTHRDATLVSATDAPAMLRRVSWGAIFAGTFIALGVMILLGMLGTAIGFQAIDPQDGNPFGGVGIGAAIWWIVTSILALAVGGFVAGRLSGIPDKASSTAHGACVWGVVTVITLWLAASTVGTVMNTAAGAVATSARVVGAVAGSASETAVAPGSPIDISEEELRSEARDVAQTVRNQVEQVDPSQLSQTAARASEEALEAMAAASWYAFFASLLSLAAAVFAAGAGAPNRTFVAARDKIET